MVTLPAWFIFAILQGLTSNAFNFFSRYLLRGNDDATVLAWLTQIVRIAVFLPIAIFFDWRLTISTESLIILFLLGISELVASYFFMKMHEHTELSISSILSRTRILWVPILAFFIIGEHLQPIEYVGIIILFIGVSIVSSPRKMFIDKGAMYTNAAAISIAFNIVLFKLATPYASNTVILAAFALPSIFIFPILMKNAKKRILISLRNKLSLKIFALLLNLLAMFFFSLAIREGEASKVTAVYQSMMIFSVIAGIIFLNERKDIVKKLIGTTITLIGVLLLTN